jgi:hypothetical protein
MRLSKSPLREASESLNSERVEVKRNWSEIMKAALFASALAVIVADVALGSDVFIPKRGQTNDQLMADKLECSALATKQTGFDPMERFRGTGPAASTRTDQGGLFEGVKTGEQRRREDQARQEWEAKITIYNRVVGACMEERGYAML